MNLLLSSITYKRPFFSPATIIFPSCLIYTAVTTSLNLNIFDTGFNGSISSDEGGVVSLKISTLAATAEANTLGLSRWQKERSDRSILLVSLYDSVSIGIVSNFFQYLASRACL
jgi:hypothetical protein